MKETRMPAAAPKTIHFNCPWCHRPVEAPDSASGRLISCPSCGREFSSPQPAPKASGSWLVLLSFALVAAVLLVGLPLMGWASRRAALARGNETPVQLRLRFQSEAETALAQQCSVAIVGLRDVINKDLRFSAADPSTWTANVTADYVNAVGGVQRVTLPFRFWTYRSTLDGRDHVLCAVDRLKLSPSSEQH